MLLPIPPPNQSISSSQGSTNQPKEISSPARRRRPAGSTPDRTSAAPTAPGSWARKRRRWWSRGPRWPRRRPRGEEEPLAAGRRGGRGRPRRRDMRGGGGAGGAGGRWRGRWPWQPWGLGVRALIVSYLVPGGSASHASRPRGSRSETHGRPIGNGRL